MRHGLRDIKPGNVLVTPGTGDDNEPVRAPRDNPFMPPVGDDRTGVTPPVGSGGAFGGGTSGLYGGTLDNAVCDPDTMVTFLQANPEKGAAWAGVLGIAPSGIPGYVARLTPAILRSDTTVTNHGVIDGRATTLQSVLQAGTAVLVDEYGVPRVRCYCGNPFTPPVRVAERRYVGRAWSGFSPDAVTTVEPVNSPIAEFTPVDPVSNAIFYRPRGSTGDRGRADIPQTPITPSPPPTDPPVRPPVDDPPAVPPVPQPSVEVRPAPPAATAPEIVDTSTYQEGVLVYFSISFTDADGDAEGFGFRGANGAGWAEESHPFSNPSYGRVSPGQVDYPFNHGCGTGQQYESDVQAWIYDSDGARADPSSSTSRARRASDSRAMVVDAQPQRPLRLRLAAPSRPRARPGSVPPSRAGAYRCRRPRTSSLEPPSVISSAEGPRARPGAGVGPRRCTGRVR